MKNPFILAASVVLLLSACEKTATEKVPDSVGESPAPTKATAGPRMATHQDLLALIHLADVYDPGGLHIDFGTASRFKYTNGNWQSGWIDDRVEGGASASTFGTKARLYLPFDGGTASRLRTRIKPYAPGTLTFSLNGKKLGTIDLSSGDTLREVVVEVPAGVSRAGENELELRATGSVRIDGKALSGAMDGLRLEPQTEGETAAPPSPTGPVKPRPVAVAGVDRTALSLQPGAQVEWFLEVPHQAVLRLETGSIENSGGALTVELAGEKKGQIRRRIDVEPRWTNAEIALGPMAGDVARLRVSNEGSTDVALSDLRVDRITSEPSRAEQQARNVIVILVDTLRASKLRLHNPKSRVTTPVLEEIAAKGALFERAQAPENWTKPSVASVLTALYPSSHLAQADAAKLSESVTMLSELYEQAGFNTASFVTNSFVSPAFGFDQGWDLNVNMDYLSDSEEGKAESVFAAAGDWISENRDERFFLYIQTIDPHAPYDPPAKYIEMYDPKPYDGQVKNQETPALLLQINKNAVQLTDRDKERLEALHDGEITYHDTELGKFLAKMQELGLDQNTILVVTSDHGEEFGEHGKWGHGHSMYQELLHVPLIVRWPGVVPANTRVAPPVSIVDIGATVLEATGVPAPQHLEGNSLMGFMLEDWPRGPHVAFSEWVNLYRTIRSYDWKLVLHAFFSPELYDLGADPWEKNKLDPAKHPIAQRYLRTLIGQFLGAPERGRWLAPTTAAPSKDGAEQKVEKQEMTPELCKQLVALGYVIAECE